MTFEVILLALVSTIRPTSLAAVYALVSSASPRRLMSVYVQAGLAFTIAFGVVVILAFHGMSIHSGTDPTKGIAEIIGGIVTLAFAGLVLTGGIAGPNPDDAPRASHRWNGLLKRRLTLRTAALAGPLSHIPGLFYLVALNVVAAHKPTVPGGLIEILIYNVIWFALPIAALAICIIQPAAARNVVETIEGWTRRNTRTILGIVPLIAGAALVVRGALTV